MDKTTFDQLIENVKQWGDDKGLIKPENAPKQFMKIVEELGEIARADIKSNEAEVEDGIGDVFVTVILYALMKGKDPKECLNIAWNEIRDRKGKLVDGSFIKE